MKQTQKTLPNVMMTLGDGQEYGQFRQAVTKRKIKRLNPSALPLPNLIKKMSYIHRRISPCSRLRKTIDSLTTFLGSIKNLKKYIYI